MPLGDDGVGSTLSADNGSTPCDTWGDHAHALDTCRKPDTCSSFKHGRFGGMAAYVRLRTAIFAISANYYAYSQYCAASNDSKVRFRRPVGKGGKGTCLGAQMWDSSPSFLADFTLQFDSCIEFILLS
eukprot:270305-Amorphochlora_amoeboformis.AAC.1